MRTIECHGPPVADSFGNLGINGEETLDRRACGDAEFQVDGFAGLDSFEHSGSPVSQGRREKVAKELATFSANGKSSQAAASWKSTPGGLKPTFLKDHGHTVLNPHLPDDDFDAALNIAQAEFDQGYIDVVVGSSRGGAVAMNIDSGDTPPLQY